MQTADVSLSTVTTVVGAMNIGELVAHFRAHELVDRGEEGKSYSTRNRCLSVLNKWILPHWQATALTQVRTVAVEDWLSRLSLARGTKAKIRKTMGLLFNHALRWEFTCKNPISGSVRGSGVRQSDKRQRIPEVLNEHEFHTLQAALGLRDRTLVWLATCCGLRRGELAGLKWKDVDLDQLTIMVRRSIVDQVVGHVKTEASQRALPIDKSIARLLQQWRSMSTYIKPEDYVFATDSNRAGERRGQQPVSLAKVMQYWIQPCAARLGIKKRIGWHTFRHTFATLLYRNIGDVKVVQELLRHSSSRITLDIYAQALTSAKRKAQGRVIRGISLKQKSA
jgi:integrase